jgi:hypothetical protein
MAERTDVRLSELRLCEVVGTSQQQRQHLVGRGLLRPAPDAGCNVRDAIELSALLQLQQELETRAAALAWSQLQPKLASIIPGARLDVVFDLRLGVLTIARSDAELAAAVTTGRPSQVIELGSRLQEVSDGFRRWAKAAPHRPRKQRQQSNEKSA